MIDVQTSRRVPWIALLILVGLPLGLLLLGTLNALGLPMPPCPMKQITGVPCATCGMTRMAQALAGGHLARAFHWHPVGAALCLLSPAVALWDLRRAWRGRPLPPLPDSPWARATAVIVLLGTWVLQIVRGI
jgi:hypothetical protein